MSEIWSRKILRCFPGKKAKWIRCKRFFSSVEHFLFKPHFSNVFQNLFCFVLFAVPECERETTPSQQFWSNFIAFMLSLKNNFHYFSWFWEKNTKIMFFAIKRNTVCKSVFPPQDYPQVWHRRRLQKCPGGVGKPQKSRGRGGKDRWHVTVHQWPCCLLGRDNPRREAPAPAAARQKFFDDQGRPIDEPLKNKPRTSAGEWDPLISIEGEGAGFSPKVGVIQSEFFYGAKYSGKHEVFPLRSPQWPFTHCNLCFPPVVALLFS